MLCEGTFAMPTGGLYSHGVTPEGPGLRLRSAAGTMCEGTFGATFRLGEVSQFEPNPPRGERARTSLPFGTTWEGTLAWTERHFSARLCAPGAFNRCSSRS